MFDTEDIMFDTDCIRLGTKYYMFDDDCLMFDKIAHQVRHITSLERNYCSSPEHTSDVFLFTSPTCYFRQSISTVDISLHYLSLSGDSHVLRIAWLASSLHRRDPTRLTVQELTDINLTSS